MLRLVFLASFYLWFRVSEIKKNFFSIKIEFHGAITDENKIMTTFAILKKKFFLYTVVLISFVQKSYKKKDTKKAQH